MIQEHKRRFLKVLVAKMEKNGTDPQELVKAVSNLEGDIRESYSEDLVPWILPSIRADLLLLENQVPYLLLQTLLTTSRLVTCLNKIAFKFFNYSLSKPEAFWGKHYGLDEAKHLLDLIRTTFFPVPSQGSIEDKIPSQGRIEDKIPSQGSIEDNCLTIFCCSARKSGSKSSFNDAGPPSFVLSAKNLHLRGIKFELKKNTDSILDISYSKGVLQIPPVVMDGFMASFILKCVAFEQLHADSSNHLTSYAAFMACLINEESDAVFLKERRILEDYYGTSDGVSQFYKNIGNEVAFDINKSHLAKVFEGLNEYTSKGFHVYCAEFVHTHFDSPWTFASSFAALLLLMFAALQVFFAAYSYFRPT
ncbi:hypothetical protein ISN44_As11g021700 [Arabidopsis suecica]|uniref:Uncharacterized protein n=1 Tax=Arabidopsis suecica TaxID=45249 RepID=A0A8T1ZAR1_ARASU|nr:hypothetical protein ISN44_As11g021700 [Arabidopsis suecica]